IDNIECRDGILIKPTEVLAAWKNGESGVSDDEVNAWVRAKRAADQEKKEAANTKAEEAAKSQPPA
ncbi:hypothetical protein DYB32_010629, partial [Aphanomyces invadans]